MISDLLFRKLTVRKVKDRLVVGEAGIYLPSLEVKRWNYEEEDLELKESDRAFPKE